MALIGYKAPRAGLNKGESFYVVNDSLRSGRVIITVGNSSQKLDSDGISRGQIYPSVNNEDYKGYVNSSIIQ
ncbi:MAG: hypothetical protein RSC49_04240 [Clostridium sp.]